jgi:hypothetical protein
MSAKFRLLVKTYRFELVAIALACLVLTGLELFLAAELNGVALPKECDFNQVSAAQGFSTQVSGSSDTGVTFGDLCQAKRDAFNAIDGQAGLALGFGAALPILAGLLIGVAAVGRELETGTVSLAWTLARSRRRWYLTRTLLLAAILIVLLSLPAFAANVLEHGRQPFVDPWQSFNDSTFRGPVLVLLGLATYAIAVVAGAALGRQLPAVIVTLVLGLGAIVGFENGSYDWERSLPVWAPADSVRYSVDILFDQAYRDKSTGAIVDQNTVMQEAPLVNDAPDGSWIDARFDPVALVVTGDHYGLVVAVESVALGGLGILLLALGMIVVDHRRPD